jgi:hypothetical protein
MSGSGAPRSEAAGGRGATAAFVLLMLAAAAALVAFDWHRGLAGLGDDSVSYLVQAQLYAGSAGTAVREWAGTATHFPPLFPLALALFGAAHDLLRAHLVVAASAALALVAIFVFVARVHGDRRIACAVVALFLLTPTAWISTLGILSDPQYLLLSFAVLALGARETYRASAPALAAFGLLLAAALLTRSAAAALVAAYAVHAGIRIARREALPRSLGLPLAVVAAAMLAWLALRVPLVGENYGLVLRNVRAWLARDAGGFVAAIARQLAGGWVANFTADPAVSMPVRVFYLLVAACAFAGAVRAAWRNRLDGWYALAYLAMLGMWLFPQEIMRRLLYPLVPLALLHAGEALFALGRRALPAARAWMAPGFAALLSAVLAAPALVATAQRATDRAPQVEGSPLDLAGMTPYYTSIPESYARVDAGRHLAVLAGLARIAERTPGDARVLWVRPDYVALLSGRTSVPWLYRDGWEATLVRMRDAGVTHVVVSSVTKGDLDGEGSTREFVTATALAPFTRRVVFEMENPVRPGEEFRLVEIDRGALAAYLDHAPPPAPAPR